jgi:hypothetical protein
MNAIRERSPHKLGQSIFGIRQQTWSNKKNKPAICQEQSISIFVCDQVQCLFAVEKNVLPSFGRKVPPVALFVCVNACANKKDLGIQTEQIIQILLWIWKVFENFKGYYQIGILKVRFRKTLSIGRGCILSFTKQLRP